MVSASTNIRGSMKERKENIEGQFFHGIDCDLVEMELINEEIARDKLQSEGSWERNHPTELEEHWIWWNLYQNNI